ncbi:MAG: hypothetical protein ACRD59_03415 [Candidatus Acidiferrales bacterium]
MEQIKSAENSGPRKFEDVGLVLLMALFVTAIVVMQIVMFWQTASLFKRYEAIGLLLVLILGSVRVIRDLNNPAAKLGRSQIAMWGYVCVMLATIAFTP